MSDDRRRTHPRSRRGRKAGGGGTIGGVGIGIAVVGFLVLRAIGSVESWQTLDSDRVELPGDAAYTLEYVLPRPLEVRVEATAVGGEELLVYWVDQEDHQAIQDGSADLQMLGTVHQQSFTDERREQTLGPGRMFIYMEAVDEVDTAIDYTVEAFQ